MAKLNLLGSWIRRFLIEYLIIDRNLSPNTQQSYRDTMRLMLPMVAKVSRKSVDNLEIEDLSPARVKSFLKLVEDARNCGVSTRNQRLCAIRSFAGFVATLSPEHIKWCGEIRAIPTKRSPRPQIAYLEKAEMDALLEAPNSDTSQGYRDHAVLLFLYNSGARAAEVAHAQIGDLDLDQSSVGCSVLIRGKGGKVRRCPLWTRTATVLRPLIGLRPSSGHVFLNRRGQPLTRYGVHALVERYAKTVAKSMPSLVKKRVSPHTIRHTTATHLLRAGVDINTIRAWLGHVSLNTTNVYAEVDLEMKAKALATCDVGAATQKPWHKDSKLLEFLNSL